MESLDSLQACSQMFGHGPAPRTASLVVNAIRTGVMGACCRTGIASWGGRSAGSMGSLIPAQGGRMLSSSPTLSPTGQPEPVDTRRHCGGHLRKWIHQGSERGRVHARNAQQHRGWAQHLAIHGWSTMVFPVVVSQSCLVTDTLAAGLQACEPDGWTAQPGESWTTRHKDCAS